MSRSTVLGRVVGLWRYPVKSMAGEPLSSVEVGWHGLVGDRRWAFIRDGMTMSGFPWLTLRECPAMAHYHPRLLDLSQPNRSATTVRTPSGDSLDVADPALAAQLWPDGARLLRQDRGIFDTFPLSLISTRTIASLARDVGRELEVMRFRPNLLIETDNEADYPEVEWVGRTLQLGELQLRVDQRDGRCVIITQDPDTGERDTRVLRQVRDRQQGCLGVYASTVRPGSVQLGDALQALD
ncbi:MAG: MOSC domain-containing protein [Xanthomonadales bacterium]|nr:MOSC domain-containing protein [Xanthomonadales bacterium]